jgi:hypothetical protein
MQVHHLSITTGSVWQHEISCTVHVLSAVVGFSILDSTTAGKIEWVGGGWATTMGWSHFPFWFTPPPLIQLGTVYTVCLYSRIFHCTLYAVGNSTVFGRSNVKGPVSFISRWGGGDVSICGSKFIGWPHRCDPTHCPGDSAIYSSSDTSDPGADTFNTKPQIQDICCREASVILVH